MDFTYKSMEEKIATWEWTDKLIQTKPVEKSGIFFPVAAEK